MEERILELIRKGEKVTTEFKAARDSLPRNLFESICALLNRNGGHIILGVSDDGKLVGVNKDTVPKIKKEFASACNNKEVLFPTIRLVMEDYIIDGKCILYIFVPNSEEVHRTKFRYFDRNEDGDYEITDSTVQIANAFTRKKNINYEDKVYPSVTLEDLRTDLIDFARKRAVLRNKNHPWGMMDDMELLKNASLYMEDSDTGKSGITLSGILLFGKDVTIANALPYYRNDCLLRIQDLDRYDDREDVRTNLLDAYDKMVSFIGKHLNDKFYLENSIRISPRDEIARELVANMLIHRELSDSSVSRLIIYKDRIYAENASKSKMTGFIDPNTFVPVPKNPKIAKVFREIGYADELGSGFGKLIKYTEMYSHKTPTFKEGDMFKATIPLDDLAITGKVSESAIEQVGEQDKSGSEQVGEQDMHSIEQVIEQDKDEILASSTDRLTMEDYKMMIVDFCQTPKTRREIQEYIGIRSRPYLQLKILKPMLENKTIVRMQASKNSKNQKYMTNNRNEEK